MTEVNPRLQRNTSADPTGEKLARKIRDCGADDSLFRALVVSVEEFRTKQYLGGFGEKAAFKDVTEGWKVVFLVNGESPFAILLSKQPPYKPNDFVKFSIQPEEPTK